MSESLLADDVIKWPCPCDLSASFYQLMPLFTPSRFLLTLLTSSCEGVAEEKCNFGSSALFHPFSEKKKKENNLALIRSMVLSHIPG